MKRKLMLLLACLFVGLSQVAAQSQTITGVVISEEDGQPVVGASVLVKGTTKGTITDIDGKFSLSNVPSSAKTLQISYIGMHSQEVAIKPTVKVVMAPDNKVLDEVMVVAFGTQKKSAFTGSATVINSEELAKRVTTNVANALVGTTPGLQLRGVSGAPGANQGKINIRGIASLYASTDPLIIVDGAPYSASLSNIPQGDIESITVLKDAASAALYGARGAAGVILVTTKTGQNKKAQITVDMKWGANTRAVQDYETIEDPGKYYEAVYGQYYSNNYYNIGQSSPTANVNANASMLKDLGYNIYSVPEGQQLIGIDGKLNPNATLGRSYTANGETYYLTADNWRDAAYSTALRQEYNLSINGAMDKGSFFASMGYLDEEGIIEYSGYKRFSARFRADYQARTWLKVAANVGYVNSTTNSNSNLGTDYGSTNLMYYTSQIAPIYPIYVRVLDANGNPQIRTDANGNPQYDFGVAATNYPGLSRSFMQTGNPLGANRYNDTYSKGSQLNGTFTLDVNLTDFLKFNSTNTLTWGHTNTSDYQSSLYGPKVSVNGQIDKSQSDVLRQNYVQSLTYFKQFGDHYLSAMIGHEYYNTKTTYLSAYGQGLFSPNIPEIDGAAKKPDSNSYTTEYNVEGYFGNIQYNYNEKYFGSASYRRDASSRFAKDNRWGNFWSVGGAWLIDKEEFFNVSWIDQLKLKLSIGQQGNDNIGNWAYTDLYSLTPASDSQMAANFYRIGNRDITWETTTNVNIGLEFGFFNNRLTGSIDYYNKKTTDLLFWLSVPESAGSRGYYGNIGDIRNSGVEVTLQGAVIRTKDIDWTLQFNIAHNSDKILKLPASKTTQLGGFTEKSKWYKVGGHLYNYFLPEYAGVNEKGEATYWVDEDLGKGVTNRPGKKRSYTTTNSNDATKYEQGNSLPSVFGGFGTTLAVHGFDLSMTFDYQLGGKIYDYQYRALMGNIASASDAGRAIHKDVLKSWSPNNTSSNIPRAQYGDQYTTGSSDRWMTSASYLNFQSFTLGYSLPKHILSNLSIDKLRLFATGENLIFWSARKGLDPRYSYGETESVNVYSPVRTIMGGIQLTF
ncbi:MAG TPA: TonB-dependent receptor [Bacteroides reticulotermitis]|nr:TonB-dependent receptor [Bacteroides reticulotermitis]